MFEVIFLIGLAIVWLIFASIQDIRKREVSNWVSYSLIIFALGGRLIYSLFSGGDLGFFYQGLIGLGIFFALSNILYYSRFFAGGDQRIMMALGPILPFYSTFLQNARVFVAFIILFLLAGFVYNFVWIIAFGIRDFKKLKKELKKQFNENRRVLLALVLLAIALLVAGFFYKFFFWIAIFTFFVSYLLIYVKAVDEVSMVRKISVEKLGEGDWLSKDLKIGKKKIKFTWNGLSKSEINFIRKHKKMVSVRVGVPYVPTFLISFVVLVLLLKFGLAEKITSLFF